MAEGRGAGDEPSSSILISLRCIRRSFLSWFSISSLRALPSFSSVLMPQPILTAVCDDADNCSGRRRLAVVFSGQQRTIDEATGVRARGDDGAQEMNPAAAQKRGRWGRAGHDGRDEVDCGEGERERCAGASYLAGAKHFAERGGGRARGALRMSAGWILED